MPKVNILQNNFSTGEVSPLFQSRGDHEMYPQALDTCLNYVSLLQGPLVRRPGSEFIWEVKDSSRTTVLVPFRFSTTQTYLLEFGDLYIRFYTDGGPILETAKNITAITKANPAVVTSNSHGYSNGDEVYISGVGGMTEVNGRRFTVANVATNTFELSGVNSSSYTTYTSGGTAERIYTIPGPFTQSELEDARFAQSADVLFIVHPNHAPSTLSRLSNTSWVAFPYTTSDGPYQAAQSTITLSVVKAGAGPIFTYNFTLSSAGFANTSSQRQLIRWRSLGIWYSLPLVYSSATVATASSKLVITDVTNITDFRLGLWYDGNFPSDVTFHDDRLCFAGVPSSPNRVDTSESGFYESFSPTESDGTVTSSNAISVTIASSQLDTTRWLMSDEKGLLLGTAGAEWLIGPASIGEPLSPTNVSAKVVSGHGSVGVRPERVGKATLFVQGAGRKLRELVYQYTVDGHEADDLTRAAEHITQTGIVQLAFMKEPFPIIWAIRNDGALLGMTYERVGEGVKVGWHRHLIGGTSDASGTSAIVESIAVIPDTTGTRDELWMIVRRRINGSSKRYVERMTKFFDESDDQEYAFFVDSGLTYDNPLTITGATAANPVVITSTSHGLSNGDRVRITDGSGMTELNGNTYAVANVAANTFELSGIDGSGYGAYISDGYARKLVSTISGLSHLEGETVAVYGDGAPQTSQVVTSGAITLASSASIVTIGLGYNSDAKLLRPQIGTQFSTSLGKVMRINEVVFDLCRTLGMKFGADFETMDDLLLQVFGGPSGHAPNLFTGLKRAPIEFNSDTENQLCIRQDQPTPGTIRSVVLDVKVE